MSRVAVLLAEGFEEIEAVAIIDVLRRAGVEVHALSAGGAAGAGGAGGGAGPGGPIVQGSHGISVRADGRLADREGEAWDMIVLPGGLPGATTLRDDPAVQRLIRRQNEARRRIGAICAAPIALGKAGILAGRKATSYPGFEKELSGAALSEERVVRDGNVVTSRGPGTAIEFALSIVEDLVSPEKAESLRKGMLVR